MVIFHELAGSALDVDQVRRALSTGVYPEMPAIFFPLAADVAVPANTNTNIMVGQFHITSVPNTVRDYCLQLGTFVVTVLMGATAGRVAIQAASAGASAVVDLAANQIATLIVLNWGTTGTGANLNELITVKSTQAATVKALDPIFNLSCTYGFQILVPQ